MAKIKLNLPTSVVEEKTLITCFEESGNKYVIFDADSVGSMGLPIILVSKIVDDRVVKIADQSEWTNVKTYLKEIIQGIGKKYAAVADSMAADEVYFTQLTLPVASFETIKKAYVPDSNSVAETNPVESPVAPVQEEATTNSQDVAAENTVVEASPIVTEDPTPIENPTVSEPVPVADVVPIAEPAPMVDTVEQAPTVEVAQAADTPIVDNDSSVDTTETSQPIPSVDVAPVVEPVPSIETPAVDSVVPTIETPSNVESSPIVENSESEKATDNNTKVSGFPALDLGHSIATESVSQEVTPDVSNIPVVTPEPAVVSDTTVSVNATNTNAYREAFLKACGEMFDSLVNAINNK